MTRFYTLLQLNMKRALKALPQLIFGATALIFLVSAVAFCGNKFLYGALSDMSEGNVFSIGVILEDDSSLANKVIEGITGMSEVNRTINFVFTNKEDAIKKLEAGEIIAAIVIPKNTAKNIVNGKNTPMTIIFPENSGFEAVIIKEVADAVANMLSSAQAGIYSIYDFYEEKNADTHISDALDRMNLKYITLAATGNQMFEATTVSATGSIPLMTYYISGGLVLFALLLGINCFGSTINVTPVVSRKLSLNGTSVFTQGLASYITLILIQLITVTIVTIPAIFIMSTFGLTLETKGIIGLIFTLPIFILISSSFVYLVTSITNLTIGQVMITFFVTIIMGFASGCFIPQIMLPDLLTSTSYLFPTTYMISFCSHIMSGEFDAFSFIMCLVFSVIFFLWGVLFTSLKRRKELA